MTELQGYAENGWGDVAEAFASNFKLGGELGAACCVYFEGRPVVDLWGGIADRRTGRPWEEDTTTVVFSTTKGPTAICAHLLVERNLLDLDAEVASYWPEFAQEGKETIRVRWLLSHQAGLPGVDQPLTLNEVCEWHPVIRALETQRPQWEPGTEWSYHALTFGFLVGEVIRRLTGSSIGRFFADEVAHPLNLSAWIGLPESEEPRVARLASEPEPFDFDLFIDTMLADVRKAGIAVPAGTKSMLKDLWGRDDPAVRLGGAFPLDAATDDGACNARLLHASEHPASGMISDARSLARMYAATVGDVDGVRLLQPSTVEAMCVPQLARTHGVPREFDAFMAAALPSARSLGFIGSTRGQPLLGPRSFGHPGNGGSLAFADPDQRVGFGYVMNRIASNSRCANSLVKAVSRCLDIEIASRS